MRVYIPRAVPLVPYPAAYCDECSTPIDPAYVSVFTGADGTFTLNLDSVPDAATLPFAIQVGRFRKYTEIPITCGETQTVPQLPTGPQPNWLPGANGTNAQIPKIVVSTGNVDHLDDVLNTLGITEYDCYEGRALPNNVKASCAKLQPGTIADVLTNSTTLAQYNMAFLSCAPDAYGTYITPTTGFYPPGSSATTGHPGGGYSQSTMTSNTQAWVEGGGRMFVTDTAYDYVAQAFPAAITWEGASGSPQPVDSANVGCTPANAAYSSVHAVPYAATINDPLLAAWLKLPAVGFLSSPNVQVVGFYEPWSTMASLASTTTNIAQGPMMPLDLTYPSTKCNAPVNTSVPLTAQFDVPTCGRVLFSSYHTYSGTTTASAANEKIMEFLIFAAAFCNQ